MMSTYDVLGIPTELSIILCCGGLVLLLAPYFGGTQVGSVTIPKLSPRATSWLKRLSPVLVVVLFLMFVPFWEARSRPVVTGPAGSVAGCEKLVAPWTGTDPADPRYRIDLAVSTTEGGHEFTARNIADGGAFFLPGEDEDEDGLPDLVVVLRPFVQRGPETLAPARPSVCLEVSQYRPPGTMEPLAGMTLQRVALLTLARGETRRLPSPDGKGELEVKFTAVTEPAAPAMTGR